MRGQEAFDTDNEIEVEVDGQKITLSEESTLEDALKKADVTYKEGASIGIFEEKKSQGREETNKYKITTSKGEFQIELYDNETESKKRWIENYINFDNLKVGWENNDALAFGSFKSNISPVFDSYKFEEFDVVFGTGGFDPDKSFIIIIKEPHIAKYGNPEDGSFAHVISGKKIVSNLEQSDTIKNIEPVIEWEETGEGYTTNDLSTKVSDGNKIYTHFEVEIDPAAPEGAESFFALVKDGTFKIDFEASSFIADDSLKGEMSKYENFEPRQTGAVSIRTAGYNTGRTYISRKDRPSSIAHSVIGYVTKGIELIKMAKQEDVLSVATIPNQIMLLGKSFKEAESRLENLDIKLTRQNHTEDDAVIVSQNPENTIDIFNQGEVEAYGVPESHLVKIELFNESAPKTVDFFRHAARLQFKNVGYLSVYFTYENTYLFKAELEAEKYKEIMPENTPENKVNAGDIGITNQAAKRMGYIGVKTEDDDMFGPTGEKFSSTNIIGRVLDIEKLKNLKDGDIMYIIEYSVRG
ncbi:methanogenesis marker 3 protein [Methanohalobium sp.]|uniref:methyl-coenzyme M reductase-associated protein Mmp3 n=1 Tax=Methanohalobium sp. TaxID=2837493 RepID=UPI0025E293F1|nr:methanogenesis marker 3 protein [Methanohalobium sp.]